MAGCAFRRAAEGILGDFGAEFSKTKTLGAGVGIFNGAVRAEREFPLKILLEGVKISVSMGKNLL